MIAPAVKTAIICDSVRAEVDGKFTCVGIYPGGSIAVRDFALPISVALYLEVIGKFSGTVQGAFRVRKFGLERPLLEFPISFNTVIDQQSPVYTVPLFFVADGPGTIVVEWLVGGQCEIVHTFQLTPQP
jgi:hypothetical protein